MGRISALNSFHENLQGSKVAMIRFASAGNRGQNTFLSATIGSFILRRMA
jgi:hypothetical protein